LPDHLARPTSRDGLFKTVLAIDAPYVAVAARGNALSI
jgi:hypothetical protein